MASVRARPERGGRFELHYIDLDGSRIRIDTRTTDPAIADLWKKKAEELLSLARLANTGPVGRIGIEDLTGGQRPKEQPPTLEEYSASYAQRCRDDYELAESTISNTTLAFESLIAVIGNKRLPEVSEEDLVKWKKSVVRRSTRTTAGIYYRHVRAAFNRAVPRFIARDGNPFIGVEEPREPRHKRRESSKKKNIPIEHVQMILKAIDEAGDTKFGQYVRMLFYLGRRRGEILSCKGEDIDTQDWKLRVWQEKTKTYIWVPIPTRLRELILAMKVKRGEYLFTSDARRYVKQKEKPPWNKTTVTHRFKKYVRELGLPETYTLHSTRQAYSNHLAEKGVPLEIRQRLLGHTSTRTTEEHYDASVPLTFREQADLVDFEPE